MRKPTPKTHRKILRRPIVLEPGINITTFDVGGRGSRVNKLPPYGEYNPNRVHVARRRRAHKENKAFPRGWKFQFESKGNISVIGDDAVQAIVNGGWTTCTKISNDCLIVHGGDIS